MGEETGASRPRGSRTRDFGAGSRISHDASSYYGSRLYEGMAPDGAAAPASPETPLPATAHNQIFLASAEQMEQLPDRCIHLMVTSPPYNVTKQYDEDLSLKEYLALLERVFGEVHRVLVDGGRACVNVANLGRKPYIPLSAHIAHLMHSLGFLQRGEIIWHKGAGAGVSMAWGSWRSASNPVLRDTHEYILVFSKGSFRRAAEGRESTIGRDEFMEWTKSVWSMNTESAQRVGHPAPFPEELPRRLLELYTYKGDVVLDPFMGSGTTAIAALRAERSFVGYELNPAYQTRALARIQAFLEPGAAEPARGRTARGRKAAKPRSEPSDLPSAVSTDTDSASPHRAAESETSIDGASADATSTKE
jgi:site-specific DNA-methyltransferase (adenine-specific)